ncbi:MAG: hypothetical protein NVS1B1_11820 [Candidatus Limnocylindrales bacterium]
MNRAAPSAPGLPGLQGRGASGGVDHRGSGNGARERQTGFKAATVGFVLMTALVVAATTGVFVLLDPRAQAFWGTKIGDLLAFARSVAGR